MGALLDGADTPQDVMLESAAPVLDLICRGIRRNSPDDRSALVAGRLIYEALYAALADATE